MDMGKSGIRTHPKLKDCLPSPHFPKVLSKTRLVTSPLKQLCFATCPLPSKAYHQQTYHSLRTQRYSSHPRYPCQWSPSSTPWLNHPYFIEAFRNLCSPGTKASWVRVYDPLLVTSYGRIWVSLQRSKVRYGGPLRILSRALALEQPE